MISSSTANSIGKCNALKDDRVFPQIGNGNLLLAGKGCHVFNLACTYGAFELMYPLSGQTTVRKTVEVRWNGANRLHNQLVAGGYEYIRLRWPQHGPVWIIFRIRSFVLHRNAYCVEYDTGFHVNIAEGVQALYIDFEPTPVRLSHDPVDFVNLKQVVSITSDRHKLLKHRTGVSIQK